MRICVKCNKSKEITFFVKKGKWRSHTCKECTNAKYRKGTVNTGRFQKGMKPNATSFKKGHVQSKEIRDKIKAAFSNKEWLSIGRNGSKHRRWRNAVKERDKWTCQQCGLKERTKLHSHHIIPWNENIKLRFELSNGITLCNSCHKKEDLKIKPFSPWSKGKKFNEEHRKKMSDSHKGRIPWNKGIKGQIPWNKGIPMKESSKLLLGSKLKGLLKGKKWKIDPETKKRKWFD